MKEITEQELLQRALTEQESASRPNAEASSDVSEQELLRRALADQQSEKERLDNEQGFLGDAVDAAQSGLLSGIAAPIGGLGRLTGVDALTDAGNYLQGMADDQVNQMSEAGRKAYQGVDIVKDEDSLLGYTFSDDTTASGLGLQTASLLGGLAPSVIPGGLAAKGLSVAGKAATGVTTGTKAAKVVDKGADVVGFGSTGSAATAGYTGHQAEQEILNATPLELKDAPLYQEHYRTLRNDGVNHETAMYQARDNLAKDIGKLAAQDGAKLGAVTQGALGPVMGKLFRGEAGGYLKSIGVGAVTEGSQEFVESGGQTAITNKTVNPVLPRDTMDGVVEDGLLGAMLGGPVGGTFAVGGKLANRNKLQTEPELDPNDPLNQPDAPETPQDAAQAELDQIDELLTNEADTFNNEEYEAFLARRDELLQILDVGDQDTQPFDMSGPQPQQPLGPPNQNIIDSEASEPTQDQLNSRERAGQTYEGQHGTGQNARLDKEYLGQSLPENTPKEGATIDGELTKESPQEPQAEKNDQLLDEPVADNIGASQAATDIGKQQEALPQFDKNKQDDPEYLLQRAKQLQEQRKAQEELIKPKEPADVVQNEIIQKSESIDAPNNPTKPSENTTDTTAAEIENAANETNTNPTEAQIDADNYKKGRVNLHGMNIAIENPKGSTRSGTDPDGNQWTSTMAHHYGDIKGVKGADGDDMDVFIGDSPESEKAFVVNQVDPKTGKFDEHKIMLGFNSMEDAEKGYLSNYEDNWAGLDSIEEVTAPELKEWVKTGDTNSPFSKSGGDQGESSYQPDTAQTTEPEVKVQKSGRPYSSERVARMSQTFKNTPNAEVVPHKGGFGIVSKYEGKGSQGTAQSVQSSNIPPSAISVSSSTELVDSQPTEFNQEDSATTLKGVNDDLTIKGTDRDALLSLSSTVKDDANTDIKGMEVDQVQKVVDEFLQEYNGNVPLEFRIKNTQEELYGPEATIDNIGRIYGAYHPRKQLFVLAASNLQDNGAVRKTLRHEIIGHYGLNILSPKDKELLLEKIAASRNSRSLKDAWRNVDQSYADAPKNVQAEEIFAFVAENEPKGLEILYDQILSSLNKGLRKVGLAKEPISRSELKSLARRIGNQIKEGEKQKTFPKDDSSSFSKKPSDDDGSGAHLRKQGPDSESKPTSVVAEDGVTIDQALQDSQATDISKDTITSEAQENIETTTSVEIDSSTVKKGSEDDGLDSNLSVGDNSDGMKADDVRAAVEPLINDLHERSTFEVVQSINDLPFAIRLQAKSRLKQSKGENPVLRGINAGDKNYLIADGLRNEKEAVEIFLHEVVGHKAVLDMLGKDGDAIMERIALSYGRKGLEDIIRTYGVEPNTKEGRILLGKEKVAHMAERGEKPTLLKRLVAAVRSWLRKYFPSIKWSDNDVLSLISNARQKVESQYMTKVDLDAQRKKKEGAYIDASIKDNALSRLKRKAEKPNKTKVDQLYNTLGQKDKSVAQIISNLAKRQFKAGGMLPDSVFSAKVERDGKMNEYELDISANLQAFRAVVKKAYGKPYDQLTNYQQAIINRQLSETKSNPRIPVSVRAAISNFRSIIKQQSDQYAEMLENEISDLRADGKDGQAQAKADLLETILNNMDTYTHRSYKAFDDPKWPQKIPKDTLEKAVAHLKDGYIDQGMDANKAETKAVRTARAIVEEGTAYEDLGSFIKESKLGAKDLSTLKRRKVIAPEIRALLGEYTDIEVNFAKTVSKMSRLIANQAFLKRVLDLGQNEGFLFDEDNKPLGKSVIKIAAEGSEVLTPLNGLYTYPEIEQAFREALGKGENGIAWVDAMVRMNGFIKYGKTVLSPTTAMRNIWSAFFFTVANGHFNVGELKKSFSVFSQYFGGDTDKAKLDYLKKLKRLGVIYDSPYAGEMMDLLKDSRIEETLLDNKPLSKVKRLNQFAQKFYQYGDDMWKIVGFENEKSMLMKYKGMSEMQAEKEAAERIRNTYPTYSMTGRFTQSLRRFPLAGTFVSFPAEIIRTSYHMLRYLKQDMKDSPAYARKKIAGLAMVSGAAFGAQAISKAMLGISDDEEEAVRDMAPEWSKNSNILFMGRDDEGKIQYMDLSFLDPYNYFKRPINAILRDQSTSDIAAQSANEMLTPFFGEDIGFGTILDIYTNKKDTGGQIFNEQDTPFNQLSDIVNHMRKGFQPGVMSNVERMFKAIDGEVSKSGKEYKVSDELIALFGFRSTTLDPKTALYYRAFDFKQAKVDANKVLKDLLRDPNKVSESDLKDAHQVMLKARVRTYERMIRLVKSAKSAGMSNHAMASILKLGGVSKADIYHLLQGKIPREDSIARTARTIAGKARMLYGEDVARDMIQRAKKI